MADVIAGWLMSTGRAGFNSLTSWRVGTTSGFVNRYGKWSPSVPYDGTKASEQARYGTGTESVNSHLSTEASGTMWQYLLRAFAHPKNPLGWVGTVPSGFSITDETDLRLLYGGSPGVSLATALAREAKSKVPELGAVPGESFGTSPVPVHAPAELRVSDGVLQWTHPGYVRGPAPEGSRISYFRVEADGVEVARVASNQRSAKVGPVESARVATVYGTTVEWSEEWRQEAPSEPPVEPQEPNPPPPQGEPLPDNRTTLREVVADLESVLVRLRKLAE